MSTPVVQRQMTHKEYEEILRINDSGEPEEAIKRLFSFFAVANKKKELQVKRFDKREYNLLVAIHDQKDTVGTLMFLIGLCSLRFSESDNGKIALMELFHPKHFQADKYQFNVYVRIYNRGLFDLHPLSPKQKVEGPRPVITPYDTYEGPVFLNYLVKWINQYRVQLKGM